MKLKKLVMSSLRDATVKALQVLAQASQNAQYPNDIDKVAFKYAQVGHKIVEATQSESPATAEQVLSQAFEVAKTIKSRDDKVKVITAIAIKYAQLKQKDKSEQLLAQALQIAENIHQ